MKKIIYIFTLILAVVSFSCKKPIEESRDYRDKWVGTYMFVTIYHEQFYPYGYYHPSTHLVCIDDTTEFIGTIEKWGENQLRIVFKPAATEPDTIHRNPVSVGTVNGIVYPRVDSIGNITYPDWTGKKEWGSFSNTEINMSYGSTGALAERQWETHKIYGIKF